MNLLVFANELINYQSSVGHFAALWFTCQFMHRYDDTALFFRATVFSIVSKHGNDVYN